MPALICLNGTDGVPLLNAVRTVEPQHASNRLSMRRPQEYFWPALTWLNVIAGGELSPQS
jgi:hypothetical protein